MALANLRLVFADLPRLRDAGDAARLRAAEYLLDHGLTPGELLHELEMDAAALGLEKYDPDQPRVSAGRGKDGGRWTNGIWDRVSHWLDEEVPVYDTDTGDEVGTQSRGRAIAANPLTIAAGRHGGFLCRPSRCGCSRCCRSKSCRTRSRTISTCSDVWTARQDHGRRQVDRGAVRCGPDAPGCRFGSRTPLDTFEWHEKRQCRH